MASPPLPAIEPALKIEVVEGHDRVEVADDRVAGIVDDGAVVH